MTRYKLVITFIFIFAIYNVISGQLLRPDIMNLGHYNPETKHYEKKTHVLGGDDHDKQPHRQHILGEDDHDKQPHRQHILGGDDHDKQPHRQHILGGDDHDKQPHRQHILGGDDHDKQLHRQHILGGDDHDKQPHTQHILGGDDHDKQPHRQHILGGDDHDKQPHRQHILGGDDHDKQPHRQHILGGDDHDKQPHRQHILGGDDHDKQPHRQHILGGDDHDKQPHRQHILGGDDHDKQPHRQHIFGGDDHDKQPHRQHILGGDDHDKQPHRQHILGGDDHDKQPHRQHIHGGDDHDKQPHRQHILGGDDHDMQPHHLHPSRVRLERGNGFHRAPQEIHLLAMDSHDRTANEAILLGQDSHDKKPHRKHQLGHDGHDQRVHGIHLLGGDGHDHMAHHQQAFGANGSGKKLHDIWLGGDHLKKPSGKLSALSSFRNFMLKYRKKYADHPEFRQRFSIFRQNLQRIKQMQRSEQGTATYGITKFADMTESEFKVLLGFKPELRRLSPLRLPVLEVPNATLPDTFDWREHNAVTPVKNQEMCGSCWAFSTTGNVEGQWALRNSQLISLSEQELVDCDKEDHGCEGGLPENAYDVIQRMGGLETETDYPYTGHDGTCHMEVAKARVQVNGSLELPQDEGKLAQWLYANGPVSIGINANPLQFYTGGVSHPPRFLCNPNSLNHGMLIVGFGTHTTKYLHRHQPYWLIKNSWGMDWGEQGYYRVYRGDGTCGVNMMATSSVVP